MTGGKMQDPKAIHAALVEWRAQQIKDMDSYITMLEESLTIARAVRDALEPVPLGTKAKGIKARLGEPVPAGRKPKPTRPAPRAKKGNGTTASLRRAVKKFPEGARVKDIAAEAGVQVQVAHTVLPRLAKQGEIRRTAQGIYGPHQAVRLGVAGVAPRPAEREVLAGTGVVHHTSGGAQG